MYTAPKLLELLAKQAERRSPHLFRSAVFRLQWRAKVGSFPSPNLETITSAGEPSRRWIWSAADFADVDQRPETLPLNGYMPASSIRGIVRAWAVRQPHISRQTVAELLGETDTDQPQAGKIEFFDAWTQTPAALTLDITNPQQRFQVYHDPQGGQNSCTPLPLYTLGDGEEPLEFTIAIRGIPRKADSLDVDTVWNWVQQALSAYGVGSRTASGYGEIQPPDTTSPQPDPGFVRREFSFILYSQGCAGVDPRNPTELRPSHWRGWLRSWLLRFFLGVMSESNAEMTVGELLGTLEAPTDQKSRKGSVRIRLIRTPNAAWGEAAEDAPRFYVWRGALQITAPEEVLDKIILPVMRFAVSVGGVGQGWRRPLHIFGMQNGNPAARGTYLRLRQVDFDQTTGKPKLRLCDLPPQPERWSSVYDQWVVSVRSRWQNRISEGTNQTLKAEVFSPHTCAVYAVPGPDREPVDFDTYTWVETSAEATRGDGMELIYLPRYKRKDDLGGSAATGGKAACSWASIKRVKAPYINSEGEQETDCQEIVCVFMGGQPPLVSGGGLRSQFLRELHGMTGSAHLFGRQSPTAN